MGDPRLPTVPDVRPMDIQDDENMLRKLHFILFNTSILSGEMQCGNCERGYPIKNGVPNMLLEEDEI